MYSGSCDRAVHPLAVMVAMVPREERRGSERDDADRQVPDDFEDPHLAVVQVADLMDQRAQAVQPEDRHRISDELLPRSDRHHEEKRSRRVGNRDAEQEVEPVAEGTDAEEIDLGLADHGPRRADPGGRRRLKIFGRGHACSNPWTAARNESG